MHVTVLMAAYNEIGTIERAVDSILQQTYRDWDLLIVDDCSTDGTYEYLLETASRHSGITVLRNNKNMGLAPSLNRGWKKCRGELIARMDADDESLPERLEQQADFMRVHPEIDVLGTGAELIGPDEATQNVVFPPETHVQIEKNIFKKTLFFHPSVMMRKSFLEEVGGYSENIIRAEDLDLWLKGIRRGHQYHNLQEVLLRYRTNSYRRPIGAICNKFISRLIIAWRYKYLVKGVAWAVIDFLKSVLTYYRLYTPRSIKEDLDQ